jgi:hypothetical protein
MSDEKNWTVWDCEVGSLQAAAQYDIDFKKKESANFSLAGPS